jgi:hypothetical protein
MQKGITGLLRSSRFQRCAIVIFTIAVFWHSIRAGAPRADQLSYLHQVSQYSTLAEIIRTAPSWNRTHSATGDEVLFRPALYVFLGLEYFLFGYNFALWQLLAITLHILVALALFSILRKSRLRDTPWPLLLTCLFSASFFGSDLVIWNHMTGYVLFCLLVALSLNTLLSFLTTGKQALLLISATCAALAMFIYELGVVYLVITAVALIWNGRASVANRSNAPREWMRIAAGLMLVVALLYAFTVVFNIESQPRLSDISALTALEEVSLGLRNTVVHAVVWAMGLLTPTSFKVVPRSRAFIAGFSFGTSLKHIANYGALILLALGINGLLLSTPRRHLLKGIARALPVLAFLAFYAGIIAFGRSLGKGLDFSLGQSLYYAYIPAFALCIAAALAAGRPTIGGSNTAEKETAARSVSLVLVGLAITVVVCLNAWSTYQLSRAYRIGYSSMRLQVINEIVEWRERQGRSSGAFFRVDPECVDNLDWFLPHVRKGMNWSGPFLMPDVLFPEHSSVLNKQTSGNVSITNIRCPTVEVRDPHDLEGLWEIGPGSPYCRISVENNQMGFENELGKLATGILDRGHIMIADWSVTGRVTSTRDGQAILWSNGWTWYRSPSARRR